MMKLAIIFLPVLFAVIWAAFVGLRINKVEIRDGKRKLINYFLFPSLVSTLFILNPIKAAQITANKIGKKMIASFIIVLILLFAQKNNL